MKKSSLLSRKWLYAKLFLMLVIVYGAVLFSEEAYAANSVSVSLTGDRDAITYGERLTFRSTVMRNVAISTTSVRLTSNAKSPMYGEDVIFTATVADPSATGMVTFYNGITALGTVSLVNGVATGTVASFEVGSYTITAKYSGDSNFEATTSAALTLTIYQASLTSSSAQSTYGTPVTFTASITPINATPITGDLSFTNGADVLCKVPFEQDGTAKCEVPLLAAGSHEISANYGGDSQYNSFTKTLTQSVSKTTSEIKVNVSQTNATESLVEVEVVTPSNVIPTGAVNLLLDNEINYSISLYGNGVTHLNLPGLAAGSHTIEAEYLGDNNVGGSKSAVHTFQVQDNNADLSGIALSNGTLAPVFSKNERSYSAQVANHISSITVTPSAASNHATMMVNGKSLSNGEKSEAVPLNVGSNTITINVKAQDGVTTKTYTLTVLREGSSDATLNRLTVSKGTLSPVFDPQTNTYTVSVDSKVTSLDITASPNNSYASVQIDGKRTTAETVALTMGQTTTIPIVVTSQNGTQKTYSVSIQSIPVTTALVLSPKTGQVIVGDTQQFQLIRELSDGTTQDQTANAVYMVSDSKVASIQGNTLTAIAPGTVTVTATYGSSTDTATITVANRVVPSVPEPVVPTPTPTPTPTPEPVPSSPSNQISVQRVLENGVISYRSYITLGNVQAILGQLTTEDERVVRVQFLAEAAAGKVTVEVQREAVALLAQQEVDLLIDLASGTLRIPHTLLTAFNEELFFRIVPVQSTVQETIEKNAQQNEQVQAFIGKQMTVNLLGQPVTIETNLQNRPVMITLPIPSDVTEAQLASLFAYIEHSDGTTEIKQGRVVEIAPGVQGYTFEVTHFSTFSLLYTTEEMLETKTAASYIQGYSDGTFKPNAAVTRAQMATMFARFLTNGEIPVATATFDDTKNNGAKDAIEFVKQAGLFNGTTHATFNPNGTITRAQMAGVVARWIERECAQEQGNIYCQETSKGKAFKDVGASHWAAASIEKVSALGIMSGNSATTFNPNGALTRAQAVKVLNQIFGRPALEGIHTSSFTDVPSTHWALEDIEAAATEQVIKK